MTERISHDEARGSVDILVDATTPEFQLESAREGLLEYITQQQALEADTVSRAEHEAALARVREAWAKESAAEKNAHRVVEDQLEAQLTALQAELDIVRAQMSKLAEEDGAIIATERARAEEAEACAGRLHADYWSRVQALSEQSAELAAANARARRIEEALKCEQVDHNETQDELAAAREDGRQIAALLESLVESGRVHPHHRTMEAMRRLLSTAPQASTEQAPPSPAMVSREEHERVVRERADVTDRLLQVTAEREALRARAEECQRYFSRMASSESAKLDGETSGACFAEAAEKLGAAISPPPGFRQIPVYSDELGTLSLGLGGFTTVRACVHCGALITGGPTACVHCVAAQPAPGGTERWAKVTRRARPEMVLDDPTPAEPQGRPEQAGEYVTRAELVEALRRAAHSQALGPDGQNALHFAAEELRGLEDK